jgi:DNA primase
MITWRETFPEMEREQIVLAAKTSLRKKEGAKALQYLKEERGFSDTVIDKFDFGFCPENTQHQLRGRIVTPIYETYGKLIALSTRHLNKDHSSRFWHESFDKGLYLYGMYYAKEHMLQTKKAIVVEGEFDVAYFHSQGFKMTVGTCGSAFTLFQIALLSRYCHEVYLLFDGDKAGRNSTKRSLDISREYDLDVYDLKFIPIYLPADKDPDEYLREVGFKEMINKMKQAKENCSL